MSSKVALTKKMLDDAPNIHEMLELAPLQNNWISTYTKTSGRDDGGLRWEQEKVLFLQLVSENKEIQKCTRFSTYAALHQLAMSGLTLREGITYMIPFKDKLVFMVGWKGRLEQINEMPFIEYVHTPQVVYDCDQFDFEAGQNPKIKIHKPAINRPDNAKIIFVYLILDTPKGPKLHYMQRAEVLSIRDRYSKSYKQYLKDLPRVVNGKIKKNGPNGAYEVDFEPPMWVTDEAEAFKKTLVKRTYKELPKLARHKALDVEIKATVGDENVDPDDLKGTQHEELEFEDIPSGNVPRETSEETETPSADPETSDIDPNYGGF